MPVSRLVFVILVLLTLPTAIGSQTAALSQQASAQSAAPPAVPTASATNSASPGTIASSAPVITVAGICEKTSSQAPACSTQITREEFERLAQVVQPEMAAGGRQRLALLYAQLLVFAHAAEQGGLDKTADAQQALQFAKLQALSQVLGRKLQADASKLSTDEIQKYYHENPKQFEEASLLRLYVPRGKAGLCGSGSLGGRTFNRTEKGAPRRSSFRHVVRFRSASGRYLRSHLRTQRAVYLRNDF